MLHYSDMTEHLETPTDLAKRLGVPVRALYRMRREGTGPPCLKIGKYLRYRPSEVDAWLADRHEGAAR